MFREAKAFPRLPMPTDFKAGGKVQILVKSRRIDVQIKGGVMAPSEIDFVMVFHDREIVVQMQTFGQVR